VLKFKNKFVYLSELVIGSQKFFTIEMTETFQNH